MMEMPDVIYAETEQREYFFEENDRDEERWNTEKYHHSRVVEVLQKENDENCRLLGMSAEREIQLLQKVQQLEDQVSCLVQNSESQTQTQQAFIKKLHRLLPDDLCPQDDKSWQQSDAFGRIEYLVSAYKSNRDELKMVWEWVVELKAKLAKTEWQPIESAPRDGTEILITDGSYVEIGLFECSNFVVRNNGDYLDGGYGRNYRTGVKFEYLEYAVPTHWMPRPEPPTTEETKCPT